MKCFDVAPRAIWNWDTFHELRKLIRRERPAVMHCTNIFPPISPAAYYAARAEGVPIVQSLRNYRLFCLNACFLRNDRVCEDCLGKRIPWPGVLRGCYRSSQAASAVVAGILSLHRGMRTWTRMVDSYYTLTEFSRRKFIEGGLPDRKVAVKPNFIHPDPGPGNGQGGDAVFIGRLSPEKGIKTLLSAWSQLGGRLPLKIIGDGPLAASVKAAANQAAGIDWLGRRQPQEVLALLGEAACLVMPSIWYETFGRTIIEAYAKGTPVVASRLGAMAELVHDGRTGVLGMRHGRIVPADFVRLTRTLRKLQPELIQTWMYHADFLGSLAAPLAGNPPVVWGIHLSVNNMHSIKRGTRVVIRANSLLSHLSPVRIVCCAENTRRSHADLGYAAAKMTVIPNGFNLAKFQPDGSARNSVRVELGLPAETKLVGMAARFHPHKDHANFVAAAAHLHRKMPEVRFVLWGKDINWKNSTLTNWINAAGLRDCFHLLDLRQDAPGRSPRS